MSGLVTRERVEQLPSAMSSTRLVGPRRYAPVKRYSVRQASLGWV